MFETPGIYNCSIYFNYPFAETKYLNITFDITLLLNFYIGIKNFTQMETNTNILSGNYDLKYYVGGIYKVNNPYNQHDGNKYLEVYCPSYYCKDNISVYMIGLVFSDGNNIELGENIDDLYDEYKVYNFELLNVKETGEYNINICEYPDYIDKEYETGYNSNSLGFITGYAKKPCDICLSTVISPNLNKNNITELKYFENNSLDEESVLINVSDSTFTPVTGISNISFEYIPTSQFESIETITGNVGTSITSSFNILPSTSVISYFDIFDNLSASIDGQISGFVENASVTVEMGILELDEKQMDELDCPIKWNQISATISLNPILLAATGTAKVPVQLYNIINGSSINLTEKPIIYQFNYEFNEIEIDYSKINGLLFESILADLTINISGYSDASTLFYKMANTINELQTSEKDSQYFEGGTLTISGGKYINFVQTYGSIYSLFNVFTNNPYNLIGDITSFLPFIDENISGVKPFQSDNNLQKLINFKINYSEKYHHDGRQLYILARTI